MIIRGRPTLLQLFFILRGSVVLRVFPQILVTVALSALVVWLHETRPGLLPFGTRDNDLPIGALADQIELSLREALGETDLPPSPKPAKYVLM